MKELFEETVKKQKERSWIPAYLSVFYLNSSTYMRTFEYLICLSNDQMTSYDYNGFGNRTGKREYDLNMRVYNSDAWNMMESQSPTREIDYLLDITKEYHNLLAKMEITSQGKTTQKFAWDSNVISMTEGASAYIYLQDELGSPVRLLDMGGNHQTVYGYDEFGRDMLGTQGEVQPFGYTGYQLDSVADTYFAQAREYMRKTGCFCGEDIIKGEIMDPESFNAYGYCCGNPVVWVDFDGKRKKSPTLSQEQAWGWVTKDWYKSANKQWHEWLDSIFKRTDDIFDVTIEFGTGLGAKGTINSVTVGGVAKSCIEVDEHFAADFKMEAGITAGYKDLFEAGILGQYSDATKDSKVLVGVESFEWDGTLKSKFGGEIYAGIGGGAYIAVDWIKVGETIYDFGKAILGCGSQK